MAYISWQQWRVARDKLRLDLFDRRYKIYDATRKFLGVIARDGRFDDGHFVEFCGATSDAEFLFDADVVLYLAQIRERSNELLTAQKVNERTPVSDVLTRRVQEVEADLVWFRQQASRITDAFKPYLGYSHIK